MYKIAFIMKKIIIYFNFSYELEKLMLIKEKFYRTNFHYEASIYDLTKYIDFKSNFKNMDRTYFYIC